MSQVLDTYRTITLDASGDGVAVLQPESFRTWTITSINVRTSQGPTETPIPQCTVYLGSLDVGNIVAQTWCGSRAPASGRLVVQPSQPLFVQWENGIPGSTATVSLYGSMDMR
jgi:hypothetical protein